MTDHELHMLVEDSQEDGFKALFQQYQVYVYTIVWDKLRSCGTKEDAEECISDIFLQVFLHFPEIQDGSLKAYIGTVAKHKAIDYFRKLRSHDACASDDPEALLSIPSEENIEQDVDVSLEQKQLLQHIQSLGEPDATIVVQRYFYDRKSKEIARHLHLTPIAVRVRLNRALKKLRQLLSES